MGRIQTCNQWCKRGNSCMCQIIFQLTRHIDHTCIIASSNQWKNTRTHTREDSIYNKSLYQTITSFVFITHDCVFLCSFVNIFSGRSQFVSLAGVPPERVVVPTAEPTTPPPTLPPPTCGAPYPPLRVGLENHARLQGSDYIAFSLSPEVLNYTRER